MKALKVSEAKFCFYAAIMLPTAEWSIELIGMYFWANS